MRDLQGKVALVTGASRGIGRALSVQLCAEGATVFGCARGLERLQETRTLCQGPGRFIGIEADTSDIEAVERMMRAIEAESGRLDFLVNNAAILGPRKFLEEVDLADWQRTQRINVDGVFIVSKLAIPLLRRADELGVMLNISSSVGRVGRAGWGPYAVSKHAVEGISGTLAEELAADNICVVSVNPGGTATDMRHEAYPDEDPKTLPSAAEIAGKFKLLLQTLTMDESKEKFNAREL